MTEHEGTPAGGPGRGATHRCDSGGPLLQYAVVLAVVAALILAVLAAAPDASGRIRDHIAWAVCEALGGQDCERPGRPSPSADPDPEERPHEDFLPPRCEVFRTQESAGYALYVGIFKFGEEFVFLEQQMADGTYRLTLMPRNFELGVEGNAFSVKTQGGDHFQFGAEAKVGAYFKGGVGDTWVFSSQEEAASFKDDIIEHQMAMDAMARNPALGLYYMINPPPEIPDPSMTTGTLRLEAGSFGEAGARVKTSTGTSYWDSGTGLQGRVRVGGQVAVRQDYRDPDHPLTATTYEIDGRVGLGTDILGAGAENLGSWSGAFRVTRDEEGELVELVWVTAVEDSLVHRDRLGNRYRGAKGGAKAKDGEHVVVESRTTLRLDTPQERAAAEAYLSEHGLTALPDLAFSQLFADDDGAMAPGDDASDFEHLLYDKGTVANSIQEVDTDAATYGAKFAIAGLTLGAKINTGSSEGHTVAAEYLGAPRGQARPFVDFTECLPGEGLR